MRPHFSSEPPLPGNSGSPSRKEPELSREGRKEEEAVLRLPKCSRANGHLRVPGAPAPPAGSREHSGRLKPEVRLRARRRCRVLPDRARRGEKEGVGVSAEPSAQPLGVLASPDHRDGLAGRFHPASPVRPPPLSWLQSRSGREAQASLLGRPLGRPPPHAKHGLRLLRALCHEARMPQGLTGQSKGVGAPWATLFSQRPTPAHKAEGCGRRGRPH